MSTMAYVTPAVLRWARESIGYQLEDAAKRIGVRPDKLQAAEDGDLMLTLRQAEKAAAVYDRPLAALFLPHPPHEDPQDAKFRRLPGAPAPPWPPEMQVIARRVERRQAAAAELYDALDEQPPWIAIRQALIAAGEPHPGTIRQLLGISEQEQGSWRDRNGYTPLREWTDAVETLGVLVLQDGTLPVSTMRGFASTHDSVPIIVVNTSDDPRARAFTIIHELGHLYLAAVGEPVGPETEKWCDSFASWVLMPEALVEQALADYADHEDIRAIDGLALRCGVTPMAAAVRVANAGIWSRQVMKEVFAAIRLRGPKVRDPGGGDYYRTQIGRLSPAYARLVFSALDGQALTYPAASGLLGGVKVNNFAKLRRTLSERSGGSDDAGL